MQKKFIVLGLAALTLLIIVGVLMVRQNNDTKVAGINSFEECAREYPVMKSAPPRCQTPDGRTFVQEDVTPPSDASGTTKEGIGSTEAASDQAVMAAKEQLAQSVSVAADDIDVVTVTEKEWPDACLGLAEEGMMCAQMITPGYEVVMQVEGKTYTYRTNSDGTVVKQQAS